MWFIVSIISVLGILGSEPVKEVNIPKHSKTILTAEENYWDENQSSFILKSKLL